MYRIQRRFITIVIMLLLLFVMTSCAFALNDDIDNLTTDQLLELRTKIDTRLAIAELGTVVYEKDGFTIQWIGFDTEDNNNFKLILLVTNPTDNPVWFKIDKVTFNGIQIGMSNAFYFEIAENSTLITSTINFCLFSYKDLNIVGLSPSDVNDLYIKFSFYDGNEWDGKIIFSDSVRIAIK